VNYAGLVFVAKSLNRQDVKGKRVVELGSWDENGAIRRLLTSYTPLEYVGVDIKAGKRVDVVCSAEDSVGRFGKGSFDVVIATELIEHTKDWRKVVSNIKNLLKPEGVMVLTTRSLGVPFHAFPRDYWRYEVEDIASILSDCQVLQIERDWERPGVFVRAVMPVSFKENDLSGIELYSMALGKRTRALEREDESLIYKLKVGRSRLRDIYYELGHWMMERI